jgi:hypothetical protein
MAKTTPAPAMASVNPACAYSRALPTRGGLSCNRNSLLFPQWEQPWHRLRQVFDTASMFRVFRAVRTTAGVLSVCDSRSIFKSRGAWLPCPTGMVAGEGQNLQEDGIEVETLPGHQPFD